MNSTLGGFQGEYRFLSNFWPAVVTYNDIEFPTVEHAYQAAKSIETIWQLQVQRMNSPGSAKRFGKIIPLREDWEQVKLGIMEDLIRQKFINDQGLKELLMATGTTQLIEVNKWNDTFWGECKGVGYNHLGKILMKIRRELNNG